MAIVNDAQAVGAVVKRIEQRIETLGLDGSQPAVPSLALGTAEVTPLSIARAYAALASEGLRVTPTGVRNVVDGAGAVLTRKPPRAVQKSSCRPNCFQAPISARQRKRSYSRWPGQRSSTLPSLRCESSPPN